MKNLSTIRGRIALLLGSFFLLVIVSVGVMFWSVRTQEKDALIINLAGRQRMLTQKMTWLALTQLDKPELSASIELFDQTLQALRFGGTTMDSAGNLVHLPPPPDPALHAQLDEVSQTWEHFQDHLQPTDMAALPLEAPLILDQLDAVVSAFETRAEAKQNRLEWIQMTFLIAAMLLLTWGFVTTRRRIVSPLTELGRAARRMGEGNLDWPIPEMGADELGELTQAFEFMRSELAASRKLLEAQVDQRTRELAAAFEFSQEIVAQRELNDLMNSVVERARLLMQAQSAALCVLSPDHSKLELVSNSGETTVDLGLIQTIESDFASPVIGAGQTTVSETSCSNCEFLRAHSPGRCVATPLRAADRTLGALCVVRSDPYQDGEIPTFDPDGQRALALLANSAAIAITNARLVKAERKKAEQAAALSEREQLAANLHDNLAQTLSFTRIKLEQLEETLTEGHLDDVHTTLNQIEAANETAYLQVRDSLVGLLKPPPSNDDFAQKLSLRVADFRSTNELPVELEIRDPSALALPSVTQAQIIHIVGEALSNIQRHAQAGQVWVRVERVNGSACFTVEDDGAGFDPQTSGRGDHFGLRIMRTRAERAGGEFSLSSTPGEGTKISISFSLKETPNPEEQSPGADT